MLACRWNSVGRKHECCVTGKKRHRARLTYIWQQQFAQFLYIHMCMFGFRIHFYILFCFSTIFSVISAITRSPLYLLLCVRVYVILFLLFFTSTLPTFCSSVDIWWAFRVTRVYLLCTFSSLFSIFNCFVNFFYKPFSLAQTRVALLLLTFGVIKISNWFCWYSFALEALRHHLLD